MSVNWSKVFDPKSSATLLKQRLRHVSQLGAVQTVVNVFEKKVIQRLLSVLRLPPTPCPRYLTGHSFPSNKHMLVSLMVLLLLKIKSNTKDHWDRYRRIWMIFLILFCFSFLVLLFWPNNSSASCTSVKKESKSTELLILHVLCVLRTKNERKKSFFFHKTRLFDETFLKEKTPTMQTFKSFGNYFN